MRLALHVGRRLVLAALAVAASAPWPGVARAGPALACDGGALVLVALREGVAVSGAEVVVAPRTALVFEVQGGTCPISLRLATNGSGATLDPPSGVYVAGAHPPVGGATDVVIAVDAGGQAASRTITVPGDGPYRAHVHDDAGLVVGCGGGGGDATWVVVVALLRARGRPRPIE